jgi:hypothetical protein
MTTSTTEIPPEVLAALALPELAGLDEDRASGRACVWERERLTIETAVDLGEQLAPADSTSVIGQRWFPRSCAGCKTPDGCEVGQGLNRLLREHRR